MDSRRIGIIAAVAAVVVVGVAVLWLRGPEPSEAPPAEVPAPVPPAPPKPDAPDVEGVPPLFPEGVEHPQSDISIDDYFARYGAAGGVIDLETRKIREDVVEDINEVLVGKQVTWDGYVQRIEDAPSGRVMLVLALKPEATGLDSAMIMFQAGWKDMLHTYQKGDRVRVVAVYDKLVSVFPSLRGISAEPLPEEG